ARRGDRAIAHGRRGHLRRPGNRSDCCRQVSPEPRLFCRPRPFRDRDLSQEHYPWQTIHLPVRDADVRLLEEKTWPSRPQALVTTLETLPAGLSTPSTRAGTKSRYGPSPRSCCFTGRITSSRPINS